MTRYLTIATVACVLAITSGCGSGTGSSSTDSGSDVGATTETGPLTTETGPPTTETTSPPTTETTAPPTTETTRTTDSAACDPNYKGACLDPSASDYDCAGGSGNGPEYVQGPIQVVGNDHFGLDRNGDGTACE